MGREQRRKEAKKHTKTNSKVVDTSFSMKSNLIIIITIAIILVVLYFILAVFVTNEISFSNSDSTTSDTSDTSSSVSNKILAANTFRQSEEVYYVYYYDFDDEDSDIATDISNITDYTVYRVDTSSSLNSNYVTDEDTGNTSASGIDELMVINPTLIEVENDHIVSYYEGKDSIIDFLNN